MEWRRFFLTTAVGGASILCVVPTASAVVLRGRVAVAKPASMAACATLDVVANVRTTDSSGQLVGDRDLMARATAIQPDGSRWRYRLDVPSSAGAGDTDQITLSARCDAGRDPLVQPNVRATGGWQNPFTAASVAAASTSGGSSDIKRNFKVRLQQVSDPPSQIVLGPSSTDAFGSVGYAGASACNATPPAFPGSDPHGTIAGSSNEPGDGCEMTMRMNGVLRFDLSGVAAYSDRIASAELRYSESAIEWRNPDGSPMVPDTCVSALTPNPAPNYGWGMSHGVADGQTTWDLTDLVTYWSETTDSPQVTLAPVQVPEDALAAACMSQISNVELVITLGN